MIPIIKYRWLLVRCLVIASALLSAAAVMATSSGARVSPGLVWCLVIAITVPTAVYFARSLPGIGWTGHRQQPVTAAGRCHLTDRQGESLDSIHLCPHRDRGL